MILVHDIPAPELYIEVSYAVLPWCVLQMNAMQSAQSLTGLVYVTYHVEELIPSIRHRLCLEDGIGFEEDAS